MNLMTSKVLRRDGLPGGVRILGRNPQGNPVAGSCLLCDYVKVADACTDEDFLTLMASHLRDHERGSAEDLADLSWEVHASCTVCDRVGSVGATPDGGLRCWECGTRWDRQGRRGLLAS